MHISRNKYKKGSRFKAIIFNHIQNNLKEYIIASIIFIIGILLGIVFFNKLNGMQLEEISTYINTSITSLKDSQTVNKVLILKNSIQKNVVFVFILWLMGSTVIGLIIVYLTVCFKAFTLGYTISAIMYTLGIGKGITFILITMLLKNIIVIPCTIALAVSGMKFYNSIMQDRRKENVKFEIVRHTIFCIFILILLVVTSFTEVFFTEDILLYYIKYL